MVEVAILIALPFLFHYLIPVMTVIPAPYTYLGAIVLLLGLALMIWAASLFRQSGAGFQLHMDKPVLVSSGPFRFSRNPMYLGMLIWLVGLAVLLGSLSVFLFPLLLFLLANFLVIPIEERNLEGTLGEAYLAYKRRVRRWL
jgi:protein-S-isoprenylcysteine O-methyltransferase Ste14